MTTVKLSIMEGEGLGDEDFPDNLERGGAHGFGCFDEAEGDFTDRGFHHAGGVRDGSNGQRNDGCGGADGGACHQSCEGDDGYHEDNEGYGADQVDNESQRLVQQRAGKDAVLFRNNQKNA